MIKKPNVNHTFPLYGTGATGAGAITGATTGRVGEITGEEMGCIREQK